MMGFTQPGQSHDGLVKEVEEEFNYSGEQRMNDRQDIEAPPVLPGANAWEQGNVYQIKAPWG
jgi:hypothetical protein